MPAHNQRDSNQFNLNATLAEYDDGFNVADPSDDTPFDVQQATRYDDPPLLKTDTPLYGGTHHKTGQRVTVAHYADDVVRGRVLFREVQSRKGKPHRSDTHDHYYRKGGGYPMSTDALTNVQPDMNGDGGGTHVTRVIIHDVSEAEVFEFTPLQYLSTPETHAHSLAVPREDRSHDPDDEQRFVRTENAVQAWADCGRSDIRVPQHTPLSEAATSRERARTDGGEQ